MNVYIARALDGSWSAVANSNDGAVQLIEAYEPDVNKRSQYQILVEPLAKLLAGQIPQVSRGLKQRLVKWDGDGPIPEDAETNPQKYPQVAEVIEGGDGIPTTTIYRR